MVHWLTDKKSGAFYGSCIVEMTSSGAAAEVVDKATSIKIDKKKVKISFAGSKDGEVWPPKDYSPRDFPPVGC